MKVLYLIVFSLIAAVFAAPNYDMDAVDEAETNSITAKNVPVIRCILDLVRQVNLCLSHRRLPCESKFHCIKRAHTALAHCSRPVISPDPLVDEVEPSPASDDDAKNGPIKLRCYQRFVLGFAACEHHGQRNCQHLVACVERQLYELRACGGRLPVQPENEQLEPSYVEITLPRGDIAKCLGTLATDLLACLTNADILSCVTDAFVKLTTCVLLPFDDKQEAPLLLAYDNDDVENAVTVYKGDLLSCIKKLKDAVVSCLSQKDKVVCIKQAITGFNTCLSSYNKVQNPRETITSTTIPETRVY